MRFLPLVSVMCALASAEASAQSLKPDQVLSSLAVRTISEPNPVLGADDRVHLAYELHVANASKLFLTLDRVEVINPSSEVLLTLSGDALSAMSILYAGEKNVMSPGSNGIILLDVSFAKDQQLPANISARISLTRRIAGADGKPAPFPPTEPVPASITFTGAQTAIGQPARLVEPPLRGPRWVAVNGCCDALTSHRGAVMSVNGVLHAPERFAIDFVQVGKNGRLFKGDGTKIADYAYYGVPIYSVADGTVVNLYDEADVQVPGPSAVPTGIVPANIGGNMLVIDIGGGAYAFYAHMQRGSLRAKLGDKVKAGQVIGLLGNTGNTTAPHLHFHLMDGTSPLDASGLPYVFTSFSSTGVLPKGGDDDLEDGRVITIDKRLSGNHANQLPLNNEVVDFP